MPSDLLWHTGISPPWPALRSRVHLAELHIRTFLKLPFPSLGFSAEILPPCLIGFCEFHSWAHVFLLLSKSDTMSVLSALDCAH